MEIIFENKKNVKVVCLFYFILWIFPFRVDANIKYSLLGIMLLILLFFKTKKNKGDLYDSCKVLLIKTKWKELIKIVLALVVFSFSIIKFLYVVMYHLDSELAQVLFKHVTVNSLAPTFLSEFCLLLNICLLAPFIEELVFRGVILNHLKLRWGINVAIIGSSALFALAHASVQYINIFVFGICWSLLYISNKNIFIAIIAHVLNNISNGIVSKLIVNIDKSYPIISDVFFILSIVYIIKYIKKNWPRKSEKVISG